MAASSPDSCAGLERPEATVITDPAHVAARARLRAQFRQPRGRASEHDGTGQGTWATTTRAFGLTEVIVMPPAKNDHGHDQADPLPRRSAEGSRITETAAAWPSRPRMRTGNATEDLLRRRPRAREGVLPVTTTPARPLRIRAAGFAAVKTMEDLDLRRPTQNVLASRSPRWPPGRSWPSAPQHRAARTTRDR